MSLLSLKASIAINGKWAPIEEKEPLAESNYKIIMIPVRSDFEAVRIDVRSGKSRGLQGGDWQSMDQPAV